MYYKMLEGDGLDRTSIGAAFSSDRIIASDRIGDVLVSTVFLAMDYGFREGSPILFETMIFGGVNDQYQKQYCLKSEAIVGHAKAVELVKSGNVV